MSINVVGKNILKIREIIYNWTTSDQMETAVSLNNRYRDENTFG